MLPGQFIKVRRSKNGDVAQLARALAWHAKGQGFESPYLHQGVTPIESGLSPQIKPIYFTGFTILIQWLTDATDFHGKTKSLSSV